MTRHRSSVVDSDFLLILLKDVMKRPQGSQSGVDECDHQPRIVFKLLWRAPSIEIPGFSTQ